MRTTPKNDRTNCFIYLLVKKFLKRLVMNEENFYAGND